MSYTSRVWWRKCQRSLRCGLRCCRTRPRNHPATIMCKISPCHEKHDHAGDWTGRRSHGCEPRRKHERCPKRSPKLSALLGWLYRDTLLDKGIRGVSPIRRKQSAQDSRTSASHLASRSNRRQPSWCGASRRRCCLQLSLEAGSSLVKWYFKVAYWHNIKAFHWNLSWSQSEARNCISILVPTKDALDHVLNSHQLLRVLRIGAWVWRMVGKSVWTTHRTFQKRIPQDNWKRDSPVAWVRRSSAWCRSHVKQRCLELPWRWHRFACADAEFNATHQPKLFAWTTSAPITQQRYEEAGKWSVKCKEAMWKR